MRTEFDEQRGRVKFKLGAHLTLYAVILIESAVIAWLTLHEPAGIAFWMRVAAITLAVGATVVGGIAVHSYRLELREIAVREEGESDDVELKAEEARRDDQKR